MCFKLKKLSPVNACKSNFSQTFASSLKHSGDFILENVSSLLLLLVNLKFVFDVYDFDGFVYFFEISIIDLWLRESSSSSL